MEVTAATTTIPLYGNASFEHTWTWTYGGNPVDLTGWTAKLYGRIPNSTKLLVELTTENGGLTLDDVGNISVLFPLSVTSLYKFDSVPFDLVLYPPSLDLSYRLLEGTITLDKGETFND